MFLDFSEAIPPEVPGRAVPRRDVPPARMHRIPRGVPRMPLPRAPVPRFPVPRLGPLGLIPLVLPFIWPGGQIAPNKKARRAPNPSYYYLYKTCLAGPHEFVNTVGFDNCGGTITGDGIGTGDSVATADYNFNPASMPAILQYYKHIRRFRSGNYWYNEYQRTQQWRKRPVVPPGASATLPSYFPVTEPDPNIARFSPADPQPFRPPLPDPGPEPPQFKLETGPNGSGPVRPRRPDHKREPPRRGEKERKVISRSKQIGMMIWRAFDQISESAELVSAIYDALPDDVKRRWSKGRKKERPAMVDSFGQYGIDGADWKLQALWHNWHKVDTVQALENIVKNQLEDKLYGAYYKRVPGRYARGL